MDNAKQQQYPLKIYEEGQYIVINKETDFKELLLHYTLIHAAGGVVFDKDQRVLMIRRRQKWDLPKGKVEKGEKYSDAALREVKEETGVKNLELGEEYPSTYHIYTMGGARILKRTFWFRMQASSSESLSPQREEEITDAVWVPCTEVLSVLEDSYPSLYDLLSSLPPFLSV